MCNARKLVAAGRGEEVVCRLVEADNAPITAARLLSLYELGGDDDMFSKELSAEVLQVHAGATPTRHHSAWGLTHTPRVHPGLSCSVKPGNYPLPQVVSQNRGGPEHSMHVERRTN